MARLTEEELAEKDSIDLLRTLTRFKYRRLMRHELNETEAVLFERFKRSLNGGDAFELDAKEILELTE